MDIRTAMALRNYGINPQSQLQNSNISSKIGKEFGGQAFEKEFDLNTKDAPALKQDFASVLKNIAFESIDTLKNAETTSMQGLNNQVDSQSVVEALAQAEMTVKTVTAVRDKVVEAYQEILRMPI